jgi:adenosylmethionine-8-amino-7-oxononanoate aminotransferase
MNKDYMDIIRRTINSESELSDEKYTRKILIDAMQMKHFVKDPLIVTEGEGIRFKDLNGKWYLDALSGIWVVNIGHQNKNVIEAMKQYLDSHVFSPPLHGVNIQGLKLANIVAELAPGNLNVVKLFTGGSEATESAMKAAKQYHVQKGNPKKRKIISFYDSFHGATMGALTATGMYGYKRQYIPLVTGHVHFHSHNCYRCPFEKTYPGCDILCAKLVEKSILKEGPDSIAGMIIEPIINVQGVMTPPLEYLPALREICSRYDIVLIFDEVITGFGRTGDLFGAITFDTVPDIICCGKGMGSGYAPLSALIVSDDIADAFWSDAEEDAFMDGHTFTYNGLSATAGIAAIKELIANDLPGNAKRMENYVKKKYKELDERFGIIGDIRGKGLMVGIEFVRDKKTKEPFPKEIAIGTRISKACLKNGLLLRASSHWISIGPPLIVSESDIDEIFEIIERSITEVMQTI